MLYFYLSLLNTPEEQEYFTDLYNRYGKMMLYIARDRLGNERDAEDAVHDVFMHIAGRKHSVMDIPPDKAAGYLAAAVKNACVDILRKSRPITPIEEAEAIPDDKGEPERIVLQDSDIPRLAALINRLPEAYASTMWCIYTGELTYSQAAGLLGTTSSAIKKRVYRGRQMLMAQIKVSGGSYV